MTTKPILLSKKGLKELKKTIANLEREVSMIDAKLKESDKADRQEARYDRFELLGRKELVETKLVEQRHVMKHAKQLPRRRDSVKVALGSVVELIDATGRRVKYMIVDTFEANPSKGKISAVSPLGSHLLGRRVQDVIEWSLGTQRVHYQLVAIS